MGNLLSFTRPTSTFPAWAQVQGFSQQIHTACR